MQALRKAGFESYLVGGCVRDLLLGRAPKDFDVATAAHPEQVRQIFRNSRLIGRRFRIAHVYFGNEIVEVATFRRAGNGNGSGERQSANGRLLSDNVYGTLQEDAFRRDFTCNALYCDPFDMSVIDYVGGMQDIENGVLQLIGDPEARYREDPVRMLRAARFIAKLGLQLAPDAEAPLRKLAYLLHDIPPARLYDEVLKLFLTGHAVRGFDELRHHHLFGAVFPLTEKALESHGPGSSPLAFVVRALENTDLRLAGGKAITPYFLFAALLWEPVRGRGAERMADGEHISVALQAAASEVLDEQAKHTGYPRSVSLPMREVWLLQPRFHYTTGQRAFRLMEHPRFRAAYDFLVLRAASGEDCGELAEWWGQFVEADDQRRLQLVNPAKSADAQRRRRKRKPRKDNPDTRP